MDDVFGPEMTPDGRFIAYLAQTNVSGTYYSQVHVWDRQTSVDTFVSRDLLGNYPASSYSDTPVITPDGRFVTFMSTATNLTTNVVVPGWHCYRRDLQAGATVLIDVDTTGTGPRDIYGAIPSMSADGRYDVFSGQDAGFVAGD